MTNDMTADMLAALAELRALDNARYEREVATITSCELRRQQATAARDGFAGAVTLLVEAIATLNAAGLADAARDMDARLSGIIDKAVAALGSPALKH